MIEKLVVAWRGMAPRERRLVGAAALVVLLAIAYLVLIEPAWKGRQQLQKELPVLRGQVAQMSALAQEAQRLGTAPKSADSPQAMRAALEASVQAAGLGASLAQVNSTAQLLDLRFAAVPHAAWLAWLDTALRETQLRVADLSISREATPGLVSVKLVLEFPKREGR